MGAGRLIRNFMKRPSALVLLAVMFAGTPLVFAQTQPQAASASEDTVVEEIVARVNNNIINGRLMLRKARKGLHAEAQGQQDKAASEQQAREHEKDLLRDLIDQQLLLQKAQDLGISADTDLVKRLDDLRKQMHAESMPCWKIWRRRRRRRESPSKISNRT